MTNSTMVDIDVQYNNKPADPARFQISPETGQQMTDTIAIKPEHLILSIPSHPKYLRLARGMVKKAAAVHGLARHEAEDIMLAVAEACANIMKHAYMNQPDGRINLYLEIVPEKLCITFEDFGRPWNPDTLEPRDLDDIRPGGMGIHLMTCTMDCVDFGCSGSNRNQLRMVKQIGGFANP